MTDLHQRSIDIIRAGQAPSGAYVASPTFSQYGYSWLRDGAFIAYGMDRAGQHDSAASFYRWAGRTLEMHRPRVEALLALLARGETPDETDYLPTRFTVDGDLGADAWWDFQLDGYGTWLWGLERHLALTGSGLPDSLRPAVELTVRYLAALWRSPNYDCWEENRGHVHPATLAAIYGGLRAALRLDPTLVSGDLPEAIRAFVLAEALAPNGHFCKYVGNPAVDASLLWLAVPFDLVGVTDPRFAATLAKIERDLLRPGGGLYRFAADVYYGGGEWVLLTAFLAWVYVRLGRVDEARVLKRWIEAQALATGELPEQVSGALLAADRYAEWEARWGAPACPLLWSHGMYLVLESALNDRDA